MYTAHGEILKADAEPAGIRLQINVHANRFSYWDVWTECTLGITNWSHRPPGHHGAITRLHRRQRGQAGSVERDTLGR